MKKKKQPHLDVLIKWSGNEHLYSGMCSALGHNDVKKDTLNLFIPFEGEEYVYGHHSSYWGEGADTDSEGLNDFRILCLCLCAAINNEL